MFKCSIGVIIFFSLTSLPSLHNNTYYILSQMHCNSNLNILFNSPCFFICNCNYFYNIFHMPLCSGSMQNSSIPSPPPTHKYPFFQFETSFSSCPPNPKICPVDIFPHSKNPSIRAVCKGPSEYSETLWFQAFSRYLILYLRQQYYCLNVKLLGYFMHNRL